MRNKKKDVCKICGEYKELTFEHIPPEIALNGQKAIVLNGQDMIDKNNGLNVRPKIKQRGMGKYSLCKDCNNKTGSWYANDYSIYAITVALNLEKYRRLNDGEWITLKYTDFNVLSFVKQIIAMFCSIIDIEDVKRLGFDSLLLSKEYNTIDKSLFDLRIYLTNKEYGSFYFGPYVAVTKKSNEVGFIKLAELGVYPFGFILNLSPQYEVKYGTSIMDLFNTEYDAEYKFILTIQYLEREKSDLPVPLNFKKKDN